MESDPGPERGEAPVPSDEDALLVHLRDDTGRIPHAAPVTREVLRRTIKDPLERPRIHLG